MSNAVKKALLVVIVVLLVAGGVFVGMNWSSWFGKEEPVVEAEIDENAEDYTGAQDTYQGEKHTDSIDIPGFDAITLKADETEQNVNFYNPGVNTCYFKMTLLLADGTILWESKLVEPDKAIYKISLNQSLEAGEYEDAVLKYECFAMDEEQTPLNGSEIRLTLKVLE